MTNSGPIPPYGVAIRTALASGDFEDMQRVAKEAYEFLGRAELVRDDLRRLEDKLGKYENIERAGAADMVPYGDPMREAIKSGDKDRMLEMANIARSWLANAEDVKKTLADLDKALKSLD
jgi:hypothetical protein